MEYSPPPLFKQGPSALARLIFFVVLALALLISDARFNTLEIVRGVLGAGLYPLQRAALVPRDIFMGATDLAITSATLRSENQKLADKNLQLSIKAGDAEQLSIENTHLRALLQLQSRATTQTTPAEVQYDTRDPFTQKVVIGKGAQQGIQDGAPVVNEDGVIGQVTRVFPLQSEVTLLSDKDQAVPVQIVRTGLRSVIYGTPKGDTLDLRFVPISADVQAGDQLVTSGLDGIYPPGLAVAKVVRVDKQADTAFARVVCLPVAPVRGARQLLVLHYNVNVPPNPVEIEAAAAAKEAKESKGKKGKASKAAAPAAGSAASAAVPAGPASASAAPAAVAKPATPASATPAAPAKPASAATPHKSRKAHLPRAASGVAQ
ncbi:rod shape-determining protein MreC [Caballeronia arationis]|jgi:rod shape-determining protein MreC|uniref:Cell shape-determining protein MreC n=1 Tax=Caballeronia arationis TaxID=1777142 RepID=A0A7Z7IBV1_9BURK|nr:rod shape-determining protein MreC [Caballeronia arationis]SAK80853.1 rod shape-determining protein MreC [Caballeronia arationis]SOE83025.1 rod shape-determining protein MreC [Caballeronia arationis]